MHIQQCTPGDQHTVVLTERVILALGPVDRAALVDPQEELLEGEELPASHVALEVVVAAHVPPGRRGHR